MLGMEEGNDNYNSVVILKENYFNRLTDDTIREIIDKIVCSLADDYKKTPSEIASDMRSLACCDKRLNRLTTNEKIKILINTHLNRVLDRAKQFVEKMAHETTFMPEEMCACACNVALWMAEYLRKNRDTIDNVWEGGYTLLRWAVASDSYNVVKLLLKNGANVNLKNSNGSTALWYAHTHRPPNEGMIRLLIKNGAQL